MKYFFIFALLLSPLIFLFVKLFFIEVNDPIKYIFSISGATAIILLLISISISLIKKWINLLKYRKTVGLFAFFYALLHLLNFIILDAQFDMMFIIEESLDKPFVYLGMISFFILLFMAISSRTKLFKKYKRYHQFIYLALFLACVHFIMAQKSLSILQYIYIFVILIIFTFKIKQKVNQFYAKVSK